MHTAIIGCKVCEIKLVEACYNAYGDGCPPCAKLAVENGNSLQQLKAEIAALAESFQFDIHGGLNYKDALDLQTKLRQLSAV